MLNRHTFSHVALYPHLRHLSFPFQQKGALRAKAQIKNMINHGFVIVRAKSNYERQIQQREAFLTDAVSSENKTHFALLV